MSKSKKFVPDWYHEKAPERSYRSILKWGDPEAFKAPNTKLYELMKETFHMTDDDFKVKQEMGLEEVDYDIPCRLSDDQIAALEAIVGKANVSTDNYDRLSVAYGKTMVDLMRLRKHIVENVPDAVVYPKNREDIIALVKYCCEQKIPMYVYGGGSSVTRGVEAVKGGITLDMLRALSGHTHQVITGVSLTSKRKQVSFSVITDVTFSNLTEAEIHYYLEEFKPYDKAGAYGIQEWIGYIGVESINGSFYNVMGLPVQRLYRELRSF